MLEFRDTLISDDVFEKHFVCDLNKCKGACCVEGELGAPVDDNERALIDEALEVVKPYLTDEALSEIEKQGNYVEEYEGEYSTPIINGAECVYAIYDENKMLKCAFEQAYNEGKTKFKKPISCYLYPIRLTQLSQFVAINYDKWDICADACTLGEKLKVPVYKFLKDPLITKFGQEWYDELEIVLEQYLAHKKLK